MAGWSTVVRMPFAPARAIEEFHLRVVHRENIVSLLIFFLLATFLYALYTAHLMWMRLPGGKFFLGLGVLCLAIGLNNFVYVFLVDVLSDAGQRQKRIVHLLLSTLAISGIFSVGGSIMYEAGILGLSKIRYGLAVGMLVLLLWQMGVEISNLRRVYGLRLFRTVLTELVGRTAGAGMAFSFIGVMSGVSRPWTHWRDILWIYGVTS